MGSLCVGINNLFMYFKIKRETVQQKNKWKKYVFTIYLITFSYFTFFSSCSWWILSKYPLHLRKYDRCWEHSNAQGRISLAFMKSKGEKDTLWTITDMMTLPSGKCVCEDLIWLWRLPWKLNFTNDWEKMKHRSLRRKKRTIQHSTWDRRIFLFQTHRKVHCNSIK